MSPRIGWAATPGLRRDLLVAGAWSVAAGVVGAMAWWLLVDLPEVTKYEGAIVLEPTELTREVGIDGWFAVIALVGGVLSGLVLSRLGRRDPLAMVVLATVGGVLSAFVMLTVGGWLGPDEHRAVLAPLPDGATTPMELAPHAPGVVWLWPAGAALGCLIRWWLTPAHGDDAQRSPEGDTPRHRVEDPA